MDILATVLTESEGRIRHHFDVDDSCQVCSLMPHIANTFAGVYPKCGDFVILRLEISSLSNDGSASIKSTN